MSTTARTTRRGGRRVPGVAEVVRPLLMEEGLGYADVLRRVRRRLPGASTTVECVRWYASRMRREGLDVPYRGPGGPG